ncbi:hypothetical protein BH09BAC1_BH09BAC1_29440 [soil metagenome]
MRTQKKTQKKSLRKSFYLTNLNITKNHVWPKQLLGFYILDRVTKLVIDQLVKEFPHNGMIPMQLIQIYEKIERSLKKRDTLKMRVANYVKYSAYLYAYIEHNLGKGRAQQLFTIACNEVTKPRLNGATEVKN